MFCLSLLAIIFASFFSFQPAVAAENECVAYAQMQVSGIVKDQRSKKKLQNVNVSVVGTHIGTVTNADGYFSLQVPDGYDKLELSLIGYNSVYINASELLNEPTILLVQNPTVLSEVIVYGGKAYELVWEALKKIPQNYSSTDNMLSMFYRETVQKRSRYISISEAMMDVFKTSYAKRYVGRDKVELKKARALMSQKNGDTLAVKFQGGPLLAIQMDAVKNPEVLFSEQDLDLYEFSLLASVNINDRQHFAVAFSPRFMEEDELLPSGVLYIDQERLAFTRITMNMDMSDKEKVEKIVLKKKPYGLKFSPEEMSFVISFRPNGEKTYISYIQSVIRFKCSWRRKFFSSAYTINTEMVVVDREENTANTIERKNQFRSHQIFSDIVGEYWDEDFWQGYNIIEPTESLEKAVSKLKKTF